MSVVAQRKKYTKKGTTDIYIQRMMDTLAKLKKLKDEDTIPGKNEASTKKSKKKRIVESFVSNLNAEGNSDEPVKLENKEISDVPKRKKKKKIVTEDAEAVQENEIPAKRKKKSKKSKQNGDIKDIVAESGGFSNEAFDPTNKSPPKIGKTTEQGISNPAFDPSCNKPTKHSKETNEDYIEEEKPQSEGKKKRKKQKRNGEEPKEGGISNAGFDENLPADSGEIECDLMINVYSAPEQTKRRKSVHFSNVTEERIIPNNEMRERNELFSINAEVIKQGIEDNAKNTAEQGFVNNGFDIRDDTSFYEENPGVSADGTDNAGFDRRAANLEEKVKTMSKTIESCEAEVDNDINEGRSVSKARGRGKGRGRGGTKRRGYNDGAPLEGYQNEFGCYNNGPQHHFGGFQNSPGGYQRGNFMGPQMNQFQNQGFGPFGFPNGPQGYIQNPNIQNGPFGFPNSPQGYNQNPNFQNGPFGFVPNGPQGNMNQNNYPPNFRNEHNWNARGRPFMRPYGGRGDYRAPKELTMDVGEPGEPAENHHLVPGGVRFSFRTANLTNKVPPYMRKPGGVLCKQRYKHLIKGDIILNFANTNFHTVRGYAVKTDG